MLRLDAEELHTILQKPSFRVFSHHIHNYGRWMRLKVALIMSIRKRLTKEALGESGKPPVIVEETAESPEETASAFGDSSSDEGGALRRQAAFVVERLAGVLARPTSSIRGRGREARGAAAALGELAAAASETFTAAAPEHGPLRAVDAAAGPRVGRDAPDGAALEPGRRPSRTDEIHPL